MVASVRPSPMPGLKPPRKGPLLSRRTVVQIFATLHVGDWDWYLVGPNQWVEQRAVGRVDLNPPPEGVTGKWIQVNLYEQTMAAYEDNRLVYATLVSSGLDKWPTRPGLFHIWSRLARFAPGIANLMMAFPLTRRLLRIAKERKMPRYAGGLPTRQPSARHRRKGDRR